MFHVICSQLSHAALKTGEMPLPHSETSVPALLGMEYPDPVGSGLSVPVLGCQSDLSGNKTPLAGTMEDPGGKGNTDKDNIQSFTNIKGLFANTRQAQWPFVTDLRRSTQ